MSEYGDVAARAVELIGQGKCSSPVSAWKAAAAKVLSTPSMQKKVCPKNTFLGLCEAGLVIGIPSGEYGNPLQNKEYALKAIKILTHTPEMKEDKARLWKAVTGGGKTHNSQMDVVVRLWNDGSLVNMKEQ